MSFVLHGIDEHGDNVEHIVIHTGKKMHNVVRRAKKTLKNMGAVKFTKENLKGPKHIMPRHIPGID